MKKILSSATVFLDPIDEFICFASAAFLNIISKSKYLKTKVQT